MDIDPIKDLFSSSDQVAWVGSGGKSSLMFHIGNHYFGNAVFSTTTKLAISESNQAETIIDLSTSNMPFDVIF